MRGISGDKAFFFLIALVAADDENTRAAWNRTRKAGKSRGDLGRKRRTVFAECARRHPAVQDSDHPVQSQKQIKTYGEPVHDGRGDPDERSEAAFAAAQRIASAPPL